MELRLDEAYRRALFALGESLIRQQILAEELQRAQLRIAELTEQAEREEERAERWHEEKEAQARPDAAASPSDAGTRDQPAKTPRGDG